MFSALPSAQFSLIYILKFFLEKIIKFHINIWKILVKSWDTLLDIRPWGCELGNMEEKLIWGQWRLVSVERRDWFQTVEDVVTMNMNHDPACKLREHHLFWDVSNWVSSVITRDQWYDHCSSLTLASLISLLLCNSGAEQWQESYL